MKLYSPAAVAIIALGFMSHRHGGYIGNITFGEIFIAAGIAVVLLVVGNIIAYLLNR